MLTALIRTESVIIIAGGAVIGTSLSCVIVFPFSSVIGSQLGLPYLLPDALQICLIAAGSVACRNTDFADIRKQNTKE